MISRLSPHHTPSDFLIAGSLLKSGSSSSTRLRRFPKGRYATVSYPWIGVSCTNWAVPKSTFRIPKPANGRHEGDPILIEIVTLPCVLALGNEAEFLWVDRLCISQTDTRDKPWHIHQMALCTHYTAIPETKQESCHNVVHPGML